MMDVFFEQLVKIKRSALSNLVLVLSLIISVGICIALFWLSGPYPILIVGIVAVGYGEWKLLGFFYKEYEYIITNGTVDVDCIIGKNSRKRVISFECTDIQRIGRYTQKNPPVTDAMEKYICGNTDDAYFLLVKKQSKKVFIVLSLNEKMLGAIKASVPKNMAVTLFSEI